MALLDLHPGRRLADGLLSLLDIHPAAFLGATQVRREARRLEQALDGLPAHLLDDIGLERVEGADGGSLKGTHLSRATDMTAALRS
jgi:anaerobic glycerol-3-phosphate dehydrogenase